MEVQRFLVGPLNTNCYLVQSKKTKETLLVDPGMACDELDDAVRELGAENLKYILLTHGHFDHIGGAAYYQRMTHGKIVLLFSCGALSAGYYPKRSRYASFWRRVNYSSPYAWPYQRQLRLLPGKYSFYRRYANALQHRQNGFSNRKSCGNESFFIQTGRFGGGIFGIPWSRRTDNASKRKGKQSIFRTK